MKGIRCDLLIGVVLSVQYLQVQTQTEYSAILRGNLASERISCTHVISSPSFEKYDRENRRITQRAEHKRRDFLLQNRRDAWRVINGPGDGAPAGLSVDKYGEYFVLNVRSSVHQERDDWSKTLANFYIPAGVIQKTWAPKVANSRSELAFGSFPASPIIIQEGSVKLLCELNSEMPTGLYLDLHEVRNWFYTQVVDTEVLNLFSYTCSFSTHAAAGGARRVTSVDAKRALKLGRENMALNNSYLTIIGGLQTMYYLLKRSRIREDKYNWIISTRPRLDERRRLFELRRDGSTP